MKNANVEKIFKMSIVLIFIMFLQALLGLVFSGAYRDVGFVSDTWFGNDLITLVLATPLFIVALVLESRRLILGRILWLGLVAYAIYN